MSDAFIQTMSEQTMWPVVDCRLLFQKASTKLLLYLMAMGQTVAPKSKAPRLNITQYSLLTHVPSGKISNGVESLFEIYSFIRALTVFRSLTWKAEKMRAKE